MDYISFYISESSAILNSEKGHNYISSTPLEVDNGWHDPSKAYLC